MINYRNLPVNNILSPLRPLLTNSRCSQLWPHAITLHHVNSPAVPVIYPAKPIAFRTTILRSLMLSSKRQKRKIEKGEKKEEKIRVRLYRVVWCITQKHLVSPTHATGERTHTSIVRASPSYPAVFMRRERSPPETTRDLQIFTRNADVLPSSTLSWLEYRVRCVLFDSHAVNETRDVYIFDAANLSASQNSLRDKLTIIFLHFFTDFKTNKSKIIFYRK